jgi:hypothetical protein
MPKVWQKEAPQKSDGQWLGGRNDSQKMSVLCLCCFSSLLHKLCALVGTFFVVFKRLSFYLAFSFAGFYSLASCGQSAKGPGRVVRNGNGISLEMHATAMPSFRSLIQLHRIPTVLSFIFLFPRGTFYSFEQTERTIQSATADV